jgi:uncharacterized protein (TIGR02300 family)
MPKEEWGVKRLCPTTGKRFYDLNKSPVVSPYTGEVVPIDLPGRKSGAPLQSDSSKSKAAESKATNDEEVLIDDDDIAVDDTDDDLLEEEDDDTVSFDDLGDVAADDDES